MKRQRPAWVGWIPVAILGIAIVGVVTASVVLRGNGLGDPAPRPTVGQVTDLNWSSFTEEGIAYIERSRDVRIDFSRGPLDAASIGLESDEVVTIGPSESLDTDNDYYLIVNGGGEGYGGHKFTVSELSVTSVDGVVTEVKAIQAGNLAFRDVLNRLTNDIDEFGWPPHDLEALFEQVNDATRQGIPYEFTFGQGDRLGMTVAATAQCQPNGQCVLEYVVADAVR